jgi:hypothetical protein
MIASIGFLTLVSCAVGAYWGAAYLQTRLLKHSWPTVDPHTLKLAMQESLSSPDARARAPRLPTNAALTSEFGFSLMLDPEPVMTPEQAAAVRHMTRAKHNSVWAFGSLFRDF